MLSLFIAIFGILSLFQPPKVAAISAQLSQQQYRRSEVANIQHEFIERGCYNNLVGILIGKSGYITSRNFTSNTNLLALTKDNNITYPQNEYCQWMIKATPGSRLRIRFTHFDVEPAKHCSFDNLSIWQISNQGINTRPRYDMSVENNGRRRGPNRQLLGVFCGSARPPIIESTLPSSLLVIFRSDASKGGSGFRLLWETVSHENPLRQGCLQNHPITLSGPQGVMQLDGYDGVTPYSSNMRCAWKIQIPAGKILRIFVENLDLEESKDCTFDALEIFDGGSPSFERRLGKYCGEDMQPFTRTSTWNEILVTFRSDNSTERTGFKLKWQEVTLAGYLEMGCWQTRPTLIRGRQSGVLNLPGFNSAVFYEPNINCKWFISVSNSSTIRIKMTHLSIESEPKSCLYDRLLFSHPNGLVRPIAFCGNHVPEEIIHWKSSELLVEFKSDESVEGTGFQFEWAESTKEDDLRLSQMPVTEKRKLTSQATETTAKTTTPSLPSKRILDLNNSSSSGAVRTTRRSFPSGLQGTQHEGSDVALSGGARQQFAPPDRPEWQQTPRPLSAPRGCPTPRRYFYSRAGKLSSPGFGQTDYPMNAHCSYVITVPEGHFVHLNFTKFDIEYSKDCQEDYIAIYNGDSEVPRKLIKKLCGFQNGRSIDSKGTRLLVVFHSNNETSYSGFSATFTAIRRPNYAEAGCWWGEDNPAEITANTGVLTSRNFDGKRPYLYNQRCAWHIHTNSSSRISVHFTHFALESSDSGCAGDTVSIYDGSDKHAPVLGIFCGIAIPPPVLSSGRDLFVIFKTDARVQRTGFRLKWNSLPWSIAMTTEATTTEVVTQRTKRVTAAKRRLPVDRHSVGVRSSSPIIQASWPGMPMPGPGGIPRGYAIPANVDRVPETYPNQFRGSPNYARRQPISVSYFPGSPSNLVALSPPGVRRIHTGDIGPVRGRSIVSPGQDARYNAKMGNVRSGAGQQPHIQQQPPFYSRPSSTATKQRKRNPTPRQSEYQNRPSGFSTFDPRQRSVHRPPPNFMPPLTKTTLTRPTPTTTRKPSTQPTTAKPHIDQMDNCIAPQSGSSRVIAGSSWYGSCSDGKPIILTNRDPRSSGGGVITSGSFDRKTMYPVLQNCVWSIRVTPGFRVSVTLRYFDLERGRDDGCPYDKVEIWDGASIPTAETGVVSSENEQSSKNVTREIGEYCGFMPQTNPILSSGSALTIKFVSDGVVQRTGFCLKWSAIPVESELMIAEEFSEVPNKMSESNSFLASELAHGEPSGCGGPKYMSQGSGHIKSPNYGSGLYHPNVYCQWVISAPPGKIVRVNLIDVDIEPDVGCRYDALSVFDGASEYAKVLKRFCGRPRPQIIRSTSNTVFLQFRSDSTAGGRGFLIEYSFTDPPT